MHRHRHFALELYDADELEQLLGSTITAREVVHEWPLSTVERVTADDGQVVACKSQYPQSLELEMYRACSGAALITPIHTEQFEWGSTLVLPWIERTGDAPASWAEISSALDSISGRPPRIADVSDPDGLLALAENVVDRLLALADLHPERFPPEAMSAAARLLELRAGTERLHHVASRNAGIVHGDLRPANVISDATGIRIIDWQRPIIGPRELDRLEYLRSTGSNPDVQPEIVHLRAILDLDWATTCQMRLIPEGDYRPWIEDALARLEARDHI